MTNRLIDMDLCLPTKIAGLLSWPKHCNVYGKDQVYVLHMGINHIKIVMNDNQLQAKAYTGMKCFPLRL